MAESKLPDMSDWTDEQIAEFWETHDSTDYVDQMEESDVQVDVPEDYRVISLLLDEYDVKTLMKVSKRKDLTHTVLLQRLLKKWLDEQKRLDDRV